MAFNTKKFKEHLDQGSALNFTGSGLPFFKGGFKAFLLGTEPSLAKTLATYMVAPLFAVAAPFMTLSRLINNKFADTKTSAVVKGLLFFPALASLVGGVAFTGLALFARETLRLALSIPAESLNVARALINTALEKKPTTRNPEQLSIKSILAMFGLGEPLKDQTLTEEVTSRDSYHAGLIMGTSPILQKTVRGSKTVFGAALFVTAAAILSPIWLPVFLYDKLKRTKKTTATDTVPQAPAGYQGTASVETAKKPLLASVNASYHAGSNPGDEDSHTVEVDFDSAKVGQPKSFWFSRKKRKVSLEG